METGVRRKKSDIKTLPSKCVLIVTLYIYYGSGCLLQWSVEEPFHPEDSSRNIENLDSAETSHVNPELQVVLVTTCPDASGFHTESHLVFLISSWLSENHNVNKCFPKMPVGLFPPSSVHLPQKLSERDATHLKEMKESSEWLLNILPSEGWQWCDTSRPLVIFKRYSQRYKENFTSFRLQSSVNESLQSRLKVSVVNNLESADRSVSSRDILVMWWQMSDQQISFMFVDGHGKLTDLLCITRDQRELQISMFISQKSANESSDPDTNEGDRIQIFFKN